MNVELDKTQIYRLRQLLKLQPVETTRNYYNEDIDERIIKSFDEAEKHEQTKTTK